MKSKRPLVIAYDIQRNKSRKRVYRILRGWRLGGQRSVHECRLSKQQAEELFLQLSEHLNPKTDSLLLAWLEPQRKILCRGIGKNDIEKHIVHVR